MEIIDSQSQRIERILEKLEQVRHKKLSCFGSETHRFRFDRPIDEAALKQFEEEHRVTLPADYRAFLKLAGNGGAGPYYGIYKLDQWNNFVDWVMDDVPANILALPCPLHPKMSREGDWESQFGDGTCPYQGMISIGTQGCTYETGLIVTGEYTGRVVYLDANGYAPYVVREPDFLRWYERWLDELLGGHDMFWFGYGIGGDESSLTKMLHDRPTSDDDRIEAIYAIGRLPKISQHGERLVCDLLRDPVPEVRAGACYAVGKFELGGAKTIIPHLLHDESSAVKKAAVKACDKLLGSACDDDFLRLLQTDDLEVAQAAGYALKERDGIPRDILLRIVQTSPHGTLRTWAAWLINWEQSDLSTLLRLLHDEHSQVRSYAVHGLRKIRQKSSVAAVIELLNRETDKNIIDSILHMLGEVVEEGNADVLLKWVDEADDFHRLAAVDSLCKLGDLRVKPTAETLLRKSHPPKRMSEYGGMSHAQSTAQLVRASLRSSPNPKIRELA